MGGVAKCIDWNDFEPETVYPGPGESLLADCREFRLRKVDLDVSSNPVEIEGGEPRPLASLLEASR